MKRGARTVFAIAIAAMYGSAWAQSAPQANAPSDRALDDILGQPAPGTAAPQPTPVPDATRPAAPAQADAAPVSSRPEDGTAPARRGPSNRLMEEIVVTAQKREENLQSVPISVQAFNADTLDAKGVEEPKSLQLSTPGLMYNEFAGYSLIYIRGVGTDAFIPSADASVATYIDNIYYPFGHSLASSLGSVERVEILKGPQGTLFGRNATGGAINIVTKQPGPEFGGSMLVDRESYGKTNLRAFTNLPITRWASLSVSGLDYSEDNYYHLSPKSPKTSLPREDSRAFTAKLGLTPIEDLKVVIGYTYINTRGSQSMSLPAADIKPLGKLLGVTQAPDFQTSEDGPTYIDTVARVLTADAKYSTSWFDLRFIGGNQDIKSPAYADYDGSSQPLLSFESFGQFARVRTAEFQVISNDQSWGHDWLKYIGGVYYINSIAGYDPLLFSAGANVLKFLANPPAGGPLSALSGLTNPLIQLIDQVPLGSGLNAGDLIDNGVTLNLQGVLSTKSTSGFFQTTVDFTDSISLTLGDRYQVETRRLDKSKTGIALNPGDPYQAIPLFDFGAQTADATVTSPKAVLDYKFNEANMAYLSYSKGYKSGTFNIIAIYAPTQYVAPERVNSYELGYKGGTSDGSVRFNAALFQNDIRNLQVQTISLTSGGAVRFETAPNARIRGADFDLTYQPLPELLPGMVISGGGAYLYGKYTNYPNGSGYDETTGLAFGGSGAFIGGGVLPGRDFTGHRLVRTPRFSGNGGLNYSFDWGDGTVELAGDVYYNCGSYFSAQNTESSREHAYYITNAHASYLYNPWGTRLTIFGKNLNNARYHYVIQDLDFDTAKLLAPPTTFGIKLQWQF